MSEIDRVRANDATLEAAKQARMEKQMEKQGFTQLDWINLNKELQVNPATGKKYGDAVSSTEKMSSVFGSNPFILIGKENTTSTCHAAAALNYLNVFSISPLLLGGFATAGCLCMGLKNVISRNSQAQQKFMRGRVAAQGFTFTAILFGFAIAVKEQMERKVTVTTREQPAVETLKKAEE